MNECVREAISRHRDRLTRELEHEVYYHHVEGEGEKKMSIRELFAISALGGRYALLEYYEAKLNDYMMGKRYQRGRSCILLVVYAKRSVRAFAISSA